MSWLPEGRPFVDRHIGLTPDAVATMLATLECESLADLMTQAVPSEVLCTDEFVLPEPLPEEAVLAELWTLAARNRPAEAMIGIGFHPNVMPPVIRRNVLENPSWYTAYTPYQPEISQGRLEALLNFQTMIVDLTGLPLANASLLDEATAAAEALALLRRAQRTRTGPFLVDADALPQTIAVVRTRAAGLGIDVVVADLEQGLPDGDFSAVLVQYPGCSGRIIDPRPIITAAHDRGAGVVVAADPLAMVLLEGPGHLGADVVVGSTQRFGVPLFFGGPHAGFIAVADGLQRHLPGRLVGVSVDADGAPAYRLALQTREQHIRRDKATSNICTAQVLLAVIASMYAVYHGPDGLAAIATRTHRYAATLGAHLARAGLRLDHDDFFDTLSVVVPDRAADVVARARTLGLHLRLISQDRVGLSTSEVTTLVTVTKVLVAFGVAADLPAAERLVADVTTHDDRIPEDLRRHTPILTHPVFHRYRSETGMQRYVRRLAARDYGLDRGMIPLGSCTMKLNATTELEPLALPGFSDLHPFAPHEDAQGYFQLIGELETWLAEVTGYDRVSVQPNAGSQGELAGLLAIRRFHEAAGEAQRDVCLIPASAHGTNAASAVLAGMRVVVVASAADGTVDLADLAHKCEVHGDRLAAIMVTYPSTHGVYEDTIAELSAMVHDHGGQVYVDGANLNALLGYARPGHFGGDVSHLNLHKTFCIPHGGGGPGVGPVAVREHLAAFLPTHPLHPDPGQREGIGPISAAPYGSAGILPITWAYIRLMGGHGLASATAAAVLAANYVAARLDEHFPVLYRGQGGWVAHECILDLRALTKATGVTVDDVAKRLVDYGFHSPTMSFPVAGTLMVEPTESEDLGEIERFCAAMIQIRGEIDQIAAGQWSVEESPLRLAPHTAQCLVGDWDRAYSRDMAVFPGGVDPDKYWPPVARIDQAYGDRHLMCACPPVEDLADD